MEQAKLVAASFDPVKNSIDLQLKGVTSASDVDFDIDGINGKAKVTGASIVIHTIVSNCGDIYTHNASMEFNLTDYSFSDALALNGSGGVKFSKVTPEETCTSRTYHTESVKFVATGINVFMTGVKATIRDEVEINFVYDAISDPGIKKEPKKSVHCYLKTSEGTVFEWDE